MLHWLELHAGLIFALSVASFFATLIVMVVVIVRMPEDYFVRTRARPWQQSDPVVRVAWVIVRNVLGLALLILGVIMLLTPGQGVLSILVGISLLDVPGKRKLQLAILRREPVQKSLNWIRQRA